MIKVSKTIFNQLNESPGFNERAESISAKDYNIYVGLTPVHRKSKELDVNTINVNEYGNTSVEMMNDEVSSVGKTSEMKILNIVKMLPPEEEEKKGGFSNVFDNLENMSGASTLFDGIDDDPPVNLNQVAERQPSAEQPHDQSQQNPSPNDNVKRIQEVDPFDMRQFNTPSDSYLGAPNDYLTQTRTLKLQNHIKIYDPSNEINKLKEELRIKQSELERMSMQLNQFQNRNMNGSLLNMSYEIHNSTSTYHLAFMFASPLVRKLNSNLEMIMQLDYQNEIKNIEKSLKDVKHEIRYKVDVATTSNFRSVVTDAPFALHFTGHGIRNDQRALGSAFMQYQDKGDILLLENENGMADYLFEDDLKRLVEMSKAKREFSHNYEVVFVSS